MSGSGLVAHLARFAGALRGAGVGVTLSDEADGLAALALVDLGDRAEVRRGLRIAMKIRPRDAARFEELFAELWRAPEDRSGVRPTGRRTHAAPRLRSGSGPFGRPSRSAEEEPDSSHWGGEEPGYSPQALLRRKSFEEYSTVDLEAMERLLDRLALRLATRPSRRRVPRPDGREIDLRRSFRRLLAQGGEPIDLARRKRAIEKPRLVVLCDTSGSMDPHTRFLLTFLLALRRSMRSCEIFAFNTALVRLTGPAGSILPGGPAGLAGPDQHARIDQALRRLAVEVPDWSGGTKIGECLAEFVEYYLDQLVNGKTVVLILSDGLDRGEVVPLACAMRALQARARRVLWLNPLAGDGRYEPTARAMAAALPFVDRLLPAHNLESLERLLPLLVA